MAVTTFARVTLTGAIGLVVALTFPAAVAQQDAGARPEAGQREESEPQPDAGSDQADVWAAVESQWNADESGDAEWIDELLVEDFAGWDTNSPAPRNRASTRMWDRALDGVRKMKAHELYPLSIIVRDDIAVAHYLYTAANENSDGEVELENGRYTDILVRTEDGWKFLAWHGGEDE